MSGYLSVHPFEADSDADYYCGVPDPTHKVGVCARRAAHPVHAVNRPDVEALARALAAHPWRTEPADLVRQSEHRRHDFNSDCAICHGDVHAIAAFMVDRSQVGSPQVSDQA